MLSNNLRMSFEKNMIQKLQKEIENGNEAVVQLQYKLEVETKALSTARGRDSNSHCQHSPEGWKEAVDVFFRLSFISHGGN